MAQAHGNSHVRFAAQASADAQAAIAAVPWSDGDKAEHERMAAESREAQKAIEAADTEPFETWRQAYMAAGNLG
jgi:glutamate--cysteine ligase